MYRTLFISMMLIAFVQRPVFAGNLSGNELTSEEKLKLGERMYRQGILPDGKPMQAMVAADVPVDGRMFTCVNCHQRSGLGSVEGSIITWPVNGKELFVPRRRTGAWQAARQEEGPGAKERWSLPAQYQAADARPAYTSASLATALRNGVDPTGRTLSRSMPRYQIDDSDMEVLINYLKNLSVEPDPGANQNSIRFATVVTEDVSDTDRQAMLSVLQSHIDTHNTQTRPHQRRARSGPFYKTEQYGAYRLFELEVWELKGEPDSWRQQLEDYYRANPVFAMLGGIANGSWSTIHKFCEIHEIPCLFPVTDQPVISDTDWYTLYLSKGLYQEGETAANYIRTNLNENHPVRIMQVYRANSGGELLSRGFRHVRGKAAELEEKILDADEKISDELLQQLMLTKQPDIILLWLDQKDMRNVNEWLITTRQQPDHVFASWTLLQGNTSAIPDGLRDKTYLTYPRDLPDDNAINLSVLKRWLKARKIPETNLDIQSQMYFLGWMLPGAVSNMRSEFYRDYFMESFDMMRDQDYAIAVFPRLTFGPGQRYAAKGCYIVQLSKGKQPELIKMSDWVIY
jgi:hypothetical protein